MREAVKNKADSRGLSKPHTADGRDRKENRLLKEIVMWAFVVSVNTLAQLQPSNKPANTLAPFIFCFSLEHVFGHFLELL